MRHCDKFIIQYKPKQQQNLNMYHELNNKKQMYHSFKLHCICFVTRFAAAITQLHVKRCKNMNNYQLTLKRAHLNHFRPLTTWINYTNKCVNFIWHVGAAAPNKNNNPSIRNVLIYFGSHAKVWKTNYIYSPQNCVRSGRPPSRPRWRRDR